MRLIARKGTVVGSARIRRLVTQETRWTDTECKRHKHEYCVPCIVKLSGDSKKHIGEDYYSAVKCLHCHSFRFAHFIPRKSEALGKTEFWPTMYFRKSRFAIGMRDLTYLGTKKPKSAHSTDAI